MKKLSFLLIAFALVTFVSMNSCKQAAQPEAEATEVVEEVQEVVDSAAVQAEAVAEEAVAE